MVRELDSTEEHQSESHEMGFARNVANRVLFMDGGEIVETAEAAKFFDAPASEHAKAFLAGILKH